MLSRCSQDSGRWRGALPTETASGAFVPEHLRAVHFQGDDPLGKQVRRRHERSPPPPKKRTIRRLSAQFTSVKPKTSPTQIFQGKFSGISRHLYMRAEVNDASRGVYHDRFHAEK